MANAFVGERYADMNNIFGGARIMILGEAHYSGEYHVGSDVPNLTNDVKGMYLDGRLGRNALFFQRIERLLTGRWDMERDGAQSKEFWDCVVFQNFVPVIAGRRPKDRPAKAMWVGRAEDDFRVNLKRHEVEIVLVCGTELWRKKPFDVARSDAYWAE